MGSVYRRFRFLFIICLCGFTCLAHAQTPANEAGKPQVKYIFLMIGDGMGAPQRAAAEMYKRIETGAEPGDPKGQLIMNQFPVKGLTTTNHARGAITDSAAAGTALACGEKTSSGVVGMNADKNKDLVSIAYTAKEAGMRVGILSNVPMDDATPATFYACAESRGQHYEIAVQAAESGFNYFAGQPFMGSGRRYKEKGDNPLKLAADAGYQVFRNNERETAMAITPGMEKVVWLPYIPYEIDRNDDNVTLLDITKKGVELLDGEEGFFMMVESGRIDGAGHANDLATNIKETLAFDETITYVYEFYKKHPNETLIVVTGDHECGGLKTSFAQGFSPERFIAAVQAQKKSGERFTRDVTLWEKANGNDEEMLKIIREVFGLADLTDKETEYLKSVFELKRKHKTAAERPKEIKKQYGSMNMIVNACQTIIARRCGVTWISFSHTAAMVSTTAIGPGSEVFAGQTDNTDIANNLRAIITAVKTRKMATALAE